VPCSGSGTRLSFHPEEVSVPHPDIAFYDFRPEQYPIQIWLLDARTYELRWHVRIDGPGVTDLPGKAATNAGKPVTVVVRDATGYTSVEEPSLA